jgi:DNA polymerase-3 subunit alpha
MATFVLEDLDGAMEVMVFPKTMQEWGSLLADDAIVCVKARLDLREDQPKLTVLEVKKPELVLDGSAEVCIDLPLNRLTDSLVTQVKQLLLDHPGDARVILRAGSKDLRLAPEFNVDARNGFAAAVRELLGPHALVS